jgi:hypothetical protein
MSDHDGLERVITIGWNQRSRSPGTRMPHSGVFMNAFKVRLVPAPRIFHLRRPTRSPDMKLLQDVHERVPILA